MNYEFSNEIKKLFSYPKKTIERVELIKLLSLPVHDTERCHLVIKKLQDKGILTAVQKSGTNGNQLYPLHNKYRIQRVLSGEERAMQSDIEKLHPSLQKDGYLFQHPDEYSLYKKELKQLSDYLFSSKIGMPISRKERSYEIFGREKVLDKKDFTGILKRLGLTDEILAFYDTPEYCFHDYIGNRSDNMTLLVLENKDIWFNARRMLFEDRITSIFQVPMDGVVYGNGNKVSNKGALTEYIRFLGEPKVKIYYWGDIDREGLDIFLRVKEYNPTLDITLFVPGYRCMLDYAEGREMEDSMDGRTHDLSGYDEIYEMFEADYAAKMKKVIDHNFLLPQEIINYEILKGLNA